MGAIENPIQSPCVLQNIIPLLYHIQSLVYSYCSVRISYHHGQDQNYKPICIIWSIYTIDSKITGWVVTTISGNPTWQNLWGRDEVGVGNSCPSWVRVGSLSTNYLFIHCEVNIFPIIIIIYPVALLNWHGMFTIEKLKHVLIIFYSKNMIFHFWHRSKKILCP